MTTIEAFLPEVDEGYRRNNDEHLFIRFCRKKFKCLIIFMLTTISICQSIGILVGAVDKETLQNIFNIVSQSPAAALNSSISPGLSTNAPLNLTHD